MTKDPVLDRIVLVLSGTDRDDPAKRDFVRFRDIIEGGCYITGGLGSGKTSTVAKALALSLLQKRAPCE